MRCNRTVNGLYYIHRMPEFLSGRLNGVPPPLPVCLPLRTQEGGWETHSPSGGGDGGGGGGTQFRRLDRNSGTLYGIISPRTVFFCSTDFYLPARHLEGGGVVSTLWLSALCKYFIELNLLYSFEVIFILYFLQVCV